MKYLALQIPGGNSITSPVKGVPTGGPATLGNIIGTGFALALLIGIITCLFMLIWGGFDWMTSQGDKQKLNQARQKLTFAILGLIIMFISFLIITTIYGFFRIPFDFLRIVG
jgi:Na+-driven multidrug efflux pump